MPCDLTRACWESRGASPRSRRLLLLRKWLPWRPLYEGSTLSGEDMPLKRSPSRPPASPRRFASVADVGKASGRRRDNALVHSCRMDDDGIIRRFQDSKEIIIASWRHCGAVTRRVNLFKKGHLFCSWEKQTLQNIDVVSSFLFRNIIWTCFIRDIYIAYVILCIWSCERLGQTNNKIFFRKQVIK